MLVGTEAETVWPHLDPEQAQVLVVEDDQRAIVGVWVLMRLIHAECVWVAPEHRGRSSVARRLVQFMRERARAWGAKTVLGHPVDPAVGRLIEKLGGTQLPGVPHVIPVDEGES